MAETATKSGGSFNWNSLLQVGPVPPLSLTSKRLTGKRVLITGAGGSIGSALASAAWASHPANLILLDTSENSLYQADRSLRDAGSSCHHASLGSVCDPDHLNRLFRTQRPQVVFHAAALKHVPLMEQNPLAAITNNAIGTVSLLKAAIAFDVEDVVLASTDKAVDPSSIMGASKRIAELALLAMAATPHASHRTRMTAIRLGNVAGSQGSVLPLFLEQIERGGPITVTHVDAHRYFITMDRAIAAMLASLEWEASPVLLVPDLGLPVRIADLARHLVGICGRSTPIEFIGLRPGDKMSETLIGSHEVWSMATAGPEGLRPITSPFPTLALIEATLDELRGSFHSGNLSRFLQSVATLVPEYQPSSAIQAALLGAQTDEQVKVTQGALR